MEEIKRQVTRAQWRLNLQQVLAWMPWTLFVALLVAAVGVAIPKIWFVQADPQVWFFSWLGGSVVAGIAAGLVLAYMHRQGALEAAIELDRRFGLKERVSSTLALTNEEKESDIGQALLSDAIRRVERVEVSEQFPVQLRRPALLPLLPMAIMLAVFFLLGNAEAEKAKASTTDETKAAQKSFENATKRLEIKVLQKKEDDADKNLKESDEMKAILEKLQGMTKTPPQDQKDALRKFNDLSKEIEKQRNNLPNKEKMKDQLQKIQEATKGPAEKLAEALKDGDMAKAQKELESLKEELTKGDMSEEKKEKLAEHLEKMKEKIEEAKKDREQAKQDLKEKIEQKKREGDPAAAGAMQQQLDEMEAQDKQLDESLEKMADKFGDLAKALKEGDAKDAAAKLDELAEDIEELQKQMAEGEQLDEIMDSLSEAKEGMKCEKCKGQGCEACKGTGNADKKGNRPGNGKQGEGQGYGERDIDETGEKGFYDDQQRVDVRNGEKKRIGTAGGPNVAGKSREDVKAEIRATNSIDPDALEEGGLSREQKEHTKQYFQQLREGK